MSSRLADAISERIAAWRGPWPAGKTKAEAVIDAIMTGRQGPLGPLRMQLELERVDEGRTP